jgi:hypothetical protein
MKPIEEMNQKELKEYAASLGIKGNLSRETMIERLQAKTEKQEEEGAHIIADEPPAKSDNRQNEIRKLLKDYEGIGIEFDKEGISWTMTYRNHIVSGNNTLPDAQITRQAEILRGRK